MSKAIFNIVCIVVFVCISMGLLAQEIALPIDTIKIIGTKIELKQIGGTTSAIKLEKISNKGQNIAELLSNQLGVYIKNYGPNTLSTLSIRGSSGSQVLVSWNEVPMNSPMLGLLDLSLIPASGFNQLQYFPGGQSAVEGSGAIGGVINLNSSISNDMGFTFESGTKFGSFGGLDKTLRIRFDHKNISNESTIVSRRANNNYTYRLVSDGPKLNLENSDFNAFDIFNNTKINLGKGRQLYLHFWHQNAQRGIPPLTTQTKSLARQKDIANRVIAEWTKVATQFTSQVKLAFTKESNQYEDPQIGINADNQFDQLFGREKVKFQLDKDQAFILGMDQSLTTVRSQNYDQATSFFRFSMQPTYQLRREKLALEASLRKSWSTRAKIPFIPQVGIDYKLSPNLEANIKSGKNFRLPGLNDQFWIPGGNEELKPESGWSQEVGLTFAIENKKAKVKLQVTAYNRQINDWILWGIKENQTFWSAQNIAKVWSRGIEQKISGSIALGESVIILKGQLHLGRSTNEIALSSPNIEKGSQLLYTPNYEGLTRLTWNYNAFSLAYQLNFTGPTKGINEDINPYLISQVELTRELNIGSQLLGIRLAINNLMNKSYVVLERRPMPGINGSIGINIRLKNKQ